MSEKITLLNAEALSCPVRAIDVPEGKFAIAEYGDDVNFIATLGLYTCKGIALYNSFERRGLLAHLGYEEDIEGSMSRLVNAFGADIRNTDVVVVQTLQHYNKEYWPATDSIARYFVEEGAPRVAIDNNDEGKSVRGIVLGLEDGKIAEIDIENRDLLEGLVTGRSHYITDWSLDNLRTN